MGNNDAYQLLIGIVFFVLLSMLISYLMTTFLFPIGIFSVYGILMLGIGLAVFMRELTKKITSNRK
jgi:hypothetical protein